MMNLKSFLLASLLFLCLTGVTQSATSTLQFDSADELQQFLSYSEKRIPLVSAHRGGPTKGFPENALETFAHSAATQPLVIECDIALSKDSVLVMMHDNTLDRTTTGTGPVDEYNHAQLKELYLQDNEGDTTTFRIPTLEEVLRWGKNKVIYTLDVKRGVPYAKVIEEVRRCKAESFSVIITYSATQAAEVHRLAPDLMISVTVKQPDDLVRLNNLGIPDNRMVAFVGSTEPNASLYELLHARKIQCILGVMGNLDKQAMARGDKIYYDLIARGADILSTDRAAEAGLALQQFRNDHQLVVTNNTTATIVQKDDAEQVEPGRVNSAEKQRQPYVILISADGFRHDYAEKYGATRLLDFGKEGVTAKSILPAYPTVTFPNHYTIVTGRYPAHHGLVNNTFYDPARNSVYSMSNKSKVQDGTWYGGTPLWVLAENQQMLSASMFWVASEAKIKGVRPTYYYKFNDKLEIGKRIQAVKNWLSLPEERRPHLITFYMSDVDHAGHSYGPDAEQTQRAVHLVDSVVYELTKVVEASGLPVNFIFLADHGMTQVKTDQPLRLPAVIDTAKFLVPSLGTLVMLYAKNKQDIQPLYQALKKEQKNYQVYLKSNMPKALHFRDTDDSLNRIGDILLLPEWPYVFSKGKPQPGYHGFPTTVKDMHAAFIAWGPAFRKNHTIASFDNVHVYPLIAHLLGLHLEDKIDGRLNVLKKILK